MIFDVYTYQKHYGYAKNVYELTELLEEILTEDETILPSLQIQKWELWGEKR